MPQRQWEGQRHGMLVLLWKKWKLGGRCKVQGRLMRRLDFDSKTWPQNLSLPIAPARGIEHRHTPWR
jgi:hypothetical protein